MGAERVGTWLILKALLSAACATSPMRESAAEFEALGPPAEAAAERMPRVPGPAASDEHPQKPRYLWMDVGFHLELASDGTYRTALSDSFGGLSLTDSGRYRDHEADIELCSDYRFRAIETKHLFLSLHGSDEFRKLPALKDALRELLSRDSGARLPAKLVVGRPEAAEVLHWWPNAIDRADDFPRDEAIAFVDELERYLAAPDINVVRLHHLTYGGTSFFAEHHLEASRELFEAAAKRGEEGSTVWLPRGETAFLESLNMPAPPPESRPSSFLAIAPNLLDLRGRRVESRCDF